jgi:2-dehydro-3-deoxyphosphogluconate aldolase/(4S)-4-hydroxy-2-oxoglutarate aldolase
VRSARIDDVVQRLERIRVVPLATLDASVARKIGETLVEAGLPCIEIAFRARGAVDAIREAAKVEGLLVGAGTILGPEQARAAADAGAAFAVAPGLSEEVVGASAAAGLPFFPGVATPTEIEHARRLGLRVLKLFPANLLGGPRFLRAVAATYPDVRFIPTGGIDASTLGVYLAMHNVLACGGSWLVSERLVRDRAFDELGRRAREAVEMVA